MGIMVLQIHLPSTGIFKKGKKKKVFFDLVHTGFCVLPCLSGDLGNMLLFKAQ